MRDFLKGAKNFVCRVIFWVFSWLPLRENVIVFESGGDFQDNAYALYNFMTQAGFFKKYRAVYCIQCPSQYKNRKDCKIINRGLRIPDPVTLYYLATSKYFIYDHFNIMAPFRKRPGQIVFNLWHGVGFKGIESGRTRDDRYCGKEDFLSSLSDFWSEYIARFCGTDIRKTVVTGYPRNDYFFRPASENAQSFAQKQGWRNFSKVIFWMPTFRRSFSKNLDEDYYKGVTGLPVIYSRDDLDELNSFLQEINVIVVFKVHYLQLSSPIFGESFSNIMFLNNTQIYNSGLHLYELLPLTDGLITDYSSISADYLLLNKPMIFTMDDYEQYKASRGFLTDNPAEYWPGHHVFDKAGLFQAISDIASGKDPFSEKRRELLPIMHKYTDGNSGARVLNVIGLKA